MPQEHQQQIALEQGASTSAEPEHTGRATLTSQELAQIEEKYRRLTSLYFKVKDYVIASEKADEEQRLSVTALNELRNAFDHDMRVKAVLYGNGVQRSELASLTPFEYCRINIDKALGHVYRAGYDALDIISLSLISEIRDLNPHTRRAIWIQVFPDYTNEIRKPLNQATDICEAAKAAKDVESADTFPVQFARYEQAIDILAGIREKLNDRLPEAVELERQYEAQLAQRREDLELRAKQAEEETRRYKKQLKLAIWGLVLAVVAIIITVVLSFIGFNLSGGSTQTSATPRPTVGRAQPTTRQNAAIKGAPAKPTKTPKR